ncbi:MAG: ABC transporter ATP-binding protein [Lentisphaeria bacterium]|nr:ABC transporter ATP-binding protein [Lentisphaeria bacterium]
MSKRVEIPEEPLLSVKQESYATYWRLLSFVKPYKGRLIMGLLSGLIASGSLFGGLMVLPQMLQGIGPAVKKEDTARIRTAERIVNTLQDGKEQSREKQLLAVCNALEKKQTDSLLPEKTAQINTFLQKYSPGSWKLRAEYQQGNILFYAKGEKFLTFPAETQSGKMTWQFFAVFAFSFILLWILRNVFIYLNHYYMRWVGTRIVTDLRNLSFRNLLNQSLGFFGKLDMGELISRTTHDTATMEAAVSNSIADATRCPLEIIACVSAIIIASLKLQNYYLPLLLFVGIPFAVLPVTIITQKIRRIFRNSFKEIASVMQRMHEVLSGIIVVKAYHAEKRENARFTAVSETYFQTVVRAIRYQLMMQPLMEVVCVSSTLIFLVFSYSQGVSVAELIQLLAPCFLIYNPIKSLSKVVTNIQRSMAAADRYFQLLDTDTSLEEKADGRILENFREGIRLEQVTFAYHERKILDQVDLNIPKGSMVAVVGSTGSGKTTIANLIARFYDVTGGRVLIDGTDIRDFRISSLREQIGIVTQEAILFNESIAANIAYGKPDATREEIIQAAKMANAHAFIVDGRHKDGYDTVVGEKGFLLSGGEKQRISIARAILRNPPILILDEATSALDTVTEKLVQDALNHVMENRTVFAIAHRLSTIRHANQIIVLDQGHIIEAGSHDELLARGGKYKELYDTQFDKNN